MEIQNQSFATHLYCRWHTTARLSIDCLQPLVIGLALCTIDNTLTMSHSGVLPTTNHVQSIFHVGSSFWGYFCAFYHCNGTTSNTTLFIKYPPYVCSTCLYIYLVGVRSFPAKHKLKRTSSSFLILNAEIHLNIHKSFFQNNSRMLSKYRKRVKEIMQSNFK